MRLPLPNKLVLVALALVALNLIDAFGTLRHISFGAEEVNPIMARFLAIGPLAFLMAKFTLSSGGILGIMAHGRARAARVALVWVLLPLYMVVAAYQVALFHVI